jgi:hypothetical protein
MSITHGVGPALKRRNPLRGFRLGLARRDRKRSLNDGRIPNPSNPFGIVPLSNFVPRGFGFVHHSIAIPYHEVPNPNLTIRNFFIAVPQHLRPQLLAPQRRHTPRQCGSHAPRPRRDKSRRARRSLPPAGRHTQPAVQPAAGRAVAAPARLRRAAALLRRRCGHAGVRGRPAKAPGAPHSDAHVANRAA